MKKLLDTDTDTIIDMVERGVGRLVPMKELQSYEGHINYLPHVLDAYDGLSWVGLFTNLTYFGKKKYFK